MATFVVSAYCVLCGDRTHGCVELPGWDGQHRVLVQEGLLCPKHEKIMGFVKSQCEECAYVWGDDYCPLYKHHIDPNGARRGSLTVEQIQMLKSGACPYRKSSTYIVGDPAITRLDKPTYDPEAGHALASALIKIENKER